MADLEALEKLLAEAGSGGRWYYVINGDCVGHTRPTGSVYDRSVGDMIVAFRDAAHALIAAARERDALREQVKMLADALEGCLRDDGLLDADGPAVELARAALRAVGRMKP